MPTKPLKPTLKDDQDADAISELLGYDTSPPPHPPAPVPVGLQGPPKLMVRDQPAHSFGEGPTLQGFGSNVISSSGNLLRGLATAVLSPVETVKGLANIGHGALLATGLPQRVFPPATPEEAESQERKADLAKSIIEYYKDRYTSELPSTIYEDPAGVAGDLATAGTLAKGLGLGAKAALVRFPTAAAAADKVASAGSALQKADLAGHVMKGAGTGGKMLATGLGRKFIGNAYGGSKLTTPLGRLPTERRREVVEFIARQGIQPTKAGYERLVALAEDTAKQQQAAIQNAASKGIMIPMDPIGNEAAAAMRKFWTKTPTGRWRALAYISRSQEEANTNPLLGQYGVKKSWGHQTVYPSNPFQTAWERISPYPGHPPPAGGAGAAGAGAASGTAAGAASGGLAGLPESAALPPANLYTPNFTFGQPPPPKVTYQIPLALPPAKPVAGAFPAPPSTPYVPPPLPQNRLPRTIIWPIAKRVRLNDLTDPKLAHEYISNAGKMADYLGAYQHDPKLTLESQFNRLYNTVGQRELASRIPGYQEPTYLYSLIAPARSAAEYVMRGTEFIDPNIVARSPVTGFIKGRVMASMGNLPTPETAATMAVAQSADALPRLKAKLGHMFYRLGQGTPLRIPLESEKTPYRFGLGLSPAKIDQAINTGKRLTRGAVLTPFRLPGPFGTAGLVGEKGIAVSQPVTGPDDEEEIQRILEILK